MTVAESAPPHRGRVAGLARHWRLVAAVALGIGPFLPALPSLRGYLFSDTVVGFVPLAYPAAAYVLWVRGHRDTAPPDREALIDALLAAALALAAVAALVLAPAWLSWYFRLYRIDLLSLALFATAAGVLVLGYHQVARLAPAFALIFLAWPYPLIRLQQIVGPAFTAVTAWWGRAVVGLAALPFTIDPQIPGVFHFTGASAPFTIVLAQVCSGTATTLGFLAIGLGLWAFTRGPLSGRLRWLASGMALAYLANLVRVTVLLVLAGDVSEHLAVDVVHPLLGLALFAAVFLALLVIHPWFGLSLDLRPRGAHLAWEGAANDRRLLAIALPVAALAAVGAGVLVVGAQAYSFAGTGSELPPVDVTSTRSVLPELPSWQLSHLDTIDWTDLFGRNSRGDLFLYDYQPTGTGIVVQTIVTDRLSTLNRYPVQQCVVFHGETIEGMRFVALPYGAVGTLIHRRVNGKLSSVLAWQFPIRVNGEVQHARIMLLLDTEEPTKPVDPALLRTGDSPAIQVGLTLRDRFEGTPWAANDPRAHVDAELEELASQIVRALAAPPNTTS